MTTKLNHPLPTASSGVSYGWLLPVGVQLGESLKLICAIPPRSKTAGYPRVYR